MCRSGWEQCSVMRLLSPWNKCIAALARVTSLACSSGLCIRNPGSFILHLVCDGGYVSMSTTRWIQKWWQSGQCRLNQKLDSNWSWRRGPYHEYLHDWRRLFYQKLLFISTLHGPRRVSLIFQMANQADHLQLPSTGKNLTMFTKGNTGQSYDNR